MELTVARITGINELDCNEKSEFSLLVQPYEQLSDNLKYCNQYNQNNSVALLEIQSEIDVYDTKVIGVLRITIFLPDS